MFKKLLKNGLDIRQERGVTLLEAAVTVLILGGGILTLVLALSGGALAVGEDDQLVMAQQLARSQMEYTKTYTYNPSATSYPTITAPSGYSITVAVASVSGTDTNIQKITVTIKRNSVTILTLQDYKVNR